ncbi:MAG: hypothetical protein E7K04_02015, partial [Helicobacter sp.]|nr:hypothetical protein [Helicobacter sp.]
MTQIKGGANKNKKPPKPLIILSAISLIGISLSADANNSISLDLSNNKNTSVVGLISSRPERNGAKKNGWRYELWSQEHIPTFWAQQDNGNNNNVEVKFNFYSRDPKTDGRYLKAEGSRGARFFTSNFQIAKYSRENYQSYCLHRESDNTIYTRLTDDAIKQITLYNIINTGAFADATKNNTENKNQSLHVKLSATTDKNEFGKDKLASRKIWADTKGYNGSISIEFSQDSNDPTIKANIINLAKQDNNKAVRYAKGWGQNDITFKK